MNEARNVNIPKGWLADINDNVIDDSMIDRMNLISEELLYENNITDKDGQITFICNNIRYIYWLASIESPIPIFNYADKLEVLVKTLVREGEIFKNGYSELINRIGLENLQLKKKDGSLITDIKTATKGGSQMEKIKKIFAQYMIITERPDVKRYAIQIESIFEETEVLPDMRGKNSNGFYINRLTGQLIKVIMNNFEKARTSFEFFSTINRLAKDMRIVNPAFDCNALSKPDISYGVRIFYLNIDAELNKMIFNMLNNLQNNFSVISYKQIFLIKEKVINEELKNLINQDTERRKHYNDNFEFAYPTDDEMKSFVLKTQSRVLKEFGVKSLHSAESSGLRCVSQRSLCGAKRPLK